MKSSEVADVVLASIEQSRSEEDQTVHVFHFINQQLSQKKLSRFSASAVRRAVEQCLLCAQFIQVVKGDFSSEVA